MTCRELVDFLMDYLANELPESEAREFEEHLRACPSCLSYLESYRITVQLSKRLCEFDDEPVPKDVPEELVQAILRSRRQA